MNRRRFLESRGIGVTALTLPGNNLVSQKISGADSTNALPDIKEYNKAFRVYSP